MIRARGFSLVELMVAITLALIVTAGVISVFVGSRSAFNATSGTAALTDGGRFALNFISDSVRGAGNMSCMKASNLQSDLNVVGSPLTSASSFGQALGGYEANVPANAYVAAPWPVATDGNNGDWIGGLDGDLTGLVIQNNDVLVVRSTLGNAIPAYVASFAVNQFDVISPPGSLANGQLAVISDCTNGEIFQITGLGGGATPTVTAATDSFVARTFPQEGSNIVGRAARPNTVAFTHALLLDICRMIVLTVLLHPEGNSG